MLTGEHTPIKMWWIILLGTGLALSPVHNQWLTILLTNAKGEVVFFLPAFAHLVTIMGSGLFLLHHWDIVKASGLGDRKIWIPLAVIVVAIGLSGIPEESITDKVAPLGMGVSLFALYQASRIMGNRIIIPLAVGAVVASLGVIAHQVVYPGVVTGGFVFEDNYDIVVGYILLGAVLYIHRWQWTLAGLAMVAILLTGSPEGIFALGVGGIVVLARRDWGRRLVIVLVPVAIVVVAGLVSGYGLTLYGYAGKVATGEIASPYGDIGVPRNATQYRLEVIKDAMTHIEPLGEGYNLTDFGRSPNVHNVPLVIVQQLGYPGILAGLAWLWVSLYCLRTTRWKYAWVMVLALSVWDHYVFTQLAPWWWVIVGVTTTNIATATATGTTADTTKSDLLFRTGVDNQAKVMI